MKDFVIFFLREKHSSIAFIKIMMLKFLMRQRPRQTILVEIQQKK